MNRNYTNKTGTALPLKQVARMTSRLNYFLKEISRKTSSTLYAHIRNLRSDTQLPPERTSRKHRTKHTRHLRRQRSDNVVRHTILNVSNSKVVTLNHRSLNHRNVTSQGPTISNEIPLNPLNFRLINRRTHLLRGAVYTDLMSEWSSVPSVPPSQPVPR